MIPPIARRFVAGESAEGALVRTAELNERDVGAICNLLGEHYDDREPADRDTTAYLDLLAAFDERDLRARVSVKPTQLGLGVGADVLRENLGRIAEEAATRNRFVWVDMEDHETTDATLTAVEQAASINPHGIGVCVQANLKRTGEDLRRLADVPATVRLVKGAYDEPATVAFRNRDRVNEAFETHLEYLFDEWDRRFAIGTHDPRLVDRAIALQREHGTPVEIQMLMGVQEDAQYELAETMDVWQYVPYGDRWASYFYRRVRERKENVLFALRAILGG